jgi:cytochrome c551
MLAVALFIAFWVVVAGGLLTIAFRGGGGPRMARVVRRRRPVANVFIGCVYLGFVVAIPLAITIGNRDRNSEQVGGVKLTVAERQGRELFGEHCGVCHTLAAANAVGKVGPNLDAIRPTDALVLRTLANGCLQSPPSTSSPQACLGYGTMPADIVEGQQASEVAAFVAAVAGHS